MIPSNITREHIIEAINEIRRSGVPSHRESVRWSLVYEGKQFPPKYVISLANKFASGRELDPFQFSGGDETNEFLKERGFEIVGKIARVQIVKVVTHHRNPQRAAELCYEEGIVAVGWTDIGDLSGLTKEEIMQKSQEKWERTPQESVSDARQLITFRDEIGQGDIVIAYRTNNIVAMIGEIEGDYFFDDKNKVGNRDGDVGYANQRRVRWWEKPRNFNRSYLPPPLNERVALPGTILICERDYERSKLIEDLRNAGLEVRFQAIQRNWWIEKTYYKGRSSRETGESSLGKALWSPQKDRRGADIYKNMRAVKRGDIILHLIDNKAIVGISNVEKECDSDFFCLPGTAWDDGTGKRPGYMVTLQGYKPLKAPLLRNDFLGQKYRQTLVRLINEGRDVFYNRNLNLRQGAYLTRVPSELLGILNEVYKEKTGEDLRHLLEPEVPTYAPLTEVNKRIFAHLALGRNIIFYGPPGTGKTRKAVEIAKWFCGEAVNRFSFETANAEWTAYDVVGGPTFSGKTRLKIKPGFLTLAAKKCSDSLQTSDVPYWLIIDEINRANLDLAFGKVFSLLDVEYRDQPIFDESELVGMENADDYRPVTIPPDFRILATMNTYDTALLFSLGYAFRRRFAFVEVGSPFLGKAEEDRYEVNEQEWGRLELTSEDQIEEIAAEIDSWILEKAYLQLSPRLKNNLKLPNFDLTESLQTKNEDFKEGKLDPFNPYILACKLSEEITRKGVIEAGYAQAVDIVKYTLIYTALFSYDAERETIVKALDEAVKAYFVPHIEYYLPRARRKMTIGEKEEEEEAINKLKDFEGLVGKLGLIRSQRKILEIISRLKMGETRIF